MSSSFALQSDQIAANVAAIPTDSADFPRVIRRDTPQALQQKPHIVPWLGHKIERAVAAACASVQADEAIGRQVRAEIEFKVRRENPSFVHIEQLQDLVEDTLMELGHNRVALAYGKYRAKRAALRELAHEQSY
ncbi:MAG: ATP cone domain-containing protein, partial [Verrucomicrobiota bacterium]